MFNNFNEASDFVALNKIRLIDLKFTDLWGRWHRPFEGEAKTLRIGRKAGKWYASFACEIGDKPALPETGRAVVLTSALVR
ncbi:MAG: hypothetical protein NTZ74_06110 [Chloroflexi bacterium]|nr:hypothetical protein [Chloroflexota bacterium]